MFKKCKPYFAVTVNFLCFLFTLIAVLNMWHATVGTANMQGSGLTVFRYFTNLSNIFLALVCIPVLIYELKHKNDYSELPLFLYSLKFTAVVSTTVTFLTCVFFLAPMFALGGGSYFFFFTGPTFFLHFLTPVLGIISVTLLEENNSFTFKHSLLGLLPTVLYSILYFVKVVIIGYENGGWFDFYGFTFGGRTDLIPYSVVGMYLATFIISYVLYRLSSKTNTNKSSEL